MTPICPSPGYAVGTVVAQAVSTDVKGHRISRLKLISVIVKKQNVKKKSTFQTTKLRLFFQAGKAF